MYAQFDTPPKITNTLDRPCSYAWQLCQQMWVRYLKTVSHCAVSQHVSA